MATTNKDFRVKHGLIVDGLGSSTVKLPLVTDGYVTTASGVLSSVATIPNSGLTNSTITINGTPISLGGSGTVSAENQTLTIGTGLSGTSYNGTTAVTIANTGVLSVNGLTGVVTGIAPISNPTFTGIATSPSFVATASKSASSSSGAYAYGTLSFSDTNILSSLQTSTTAYAQMVIQNTNSGNAASADFTIANNLGTASTYYVNLGMNSSGYTGSGSLNTPNAGYLTVTTGDLVIGTTTANAIKFVTNSSATDFLTISSTGISTFGSQAVFPASTTALASINIPHGTAPTTPVNGDVWTTTAGMFARINGTTVGPFSAASGSLLTTNNSWTGTNSWTQVGTFSYSTTNQANQVPALNLSGTPKTGNPLNMATGLLQVGPIATSVTTSSVLADTNILGVFSTPFNDYVQTLFINPSNGNSASADICLYNDQTFEKGGLGSYADIGLSSSAYTTNTFWPAFSTPGGMYIYMQGGALTIGTQHNGTSVNTSAVPYDNDFGIATDDLRRVTLQGGKLNAVSYWTFESNLAGVVFNSPVTTLPTTTASTNSTALTISTGNATGTTSTSGSISIDPGTGTTSAGNINIGTTNANTITIGSSAANKGFVVAYPAAGTTTTAAVSAGYMGMPLNAITASGTHTYTFQASDAGKNIYVTGTPTSSTLTINSNANLALPIGTTFVIMNDLGAATNISIAITTDTMQLAGTGTTGTRTLARYGVATVTKVTATKWIISGNGLT